MNALHYNIIFDVTQTGFRHWLGLAVSVILFILTMGFMWYKRQVSKGFHRFTLVFLLLLFCSGFIVALLLCSYLNYLSLESAMRQSKCEVTEGIVSDFQKFTHTHMSGGKTRTATSSSGESFVVNGKSFRYMEHSVWSGFDELGIIHNGLQVRIYYFKNDIARLEIAQ